MATFRARRLSAENRDYEFENLKSQWTKKASRKFPREIWDYF